MDRNLEGKIDNRRLNEGLFWIDEHPPKIDLYATFKDCAVIIVALLLLLSAWSWAMTRDYHERMEHDAKALAACMNGDTLHERDNDIAHFCDKSKPTKLGVKK